ncbi:MAG: hypothetical protein M1830_008521 [Pleopsidium flavum]|nr:MAG: hypothetical protein M1830_008521 [Pleopsidium flavum]
MPLRINIPPLTRILLVVLVALSILYNAIRYRQWIDSVAYLAIEPQSALIYPWVFLSAALVEQNIVTLLIAGATILYGGKYLERAWSSAEFGKFLLTVSLIPNILAWGVYLVLFAIIGDEKGLTTTINGSIALQASFLVAFKQLVPEHTVTIARGFIKIRVKHFPAIFLVANTISGVVFGTDTALVLAWLGILTSWTYLRFYKWQPDLSSASTSGVSGIRGDASETFAFAYFWPDVVHGPIAAVSDSIYNALVALRICTPFSAEDVETSNEQAMARGEGGLPSLLNQGGRRGGSGKREEAERRRALALKALDQRLHAATTNKAPTAANPGSGPSMLGETNYNPDDRETGGDSTN